MPRTRVFKSGNSQAVMIPAELAYTDMDIDLEITRVGDHHDLSGARQPEERGCGVAAYAKAASRRTKTTARSARARGLMRFEIET